MMMALSAALPCSDVRDGVVCADSPAKVYFSLGEEIVMMELGTQELI